MSRQLDLPTQNDKGSVERSPATAYDQDYFFWTQEQARFLRQGELARLDIENLAEEVSSLGRSVEREIEAYLAILLLHLLMWRVRPKEPFPTWKGTIVEHRRRLARDLRENPSLRGYPTELLSEEYDIARLKAAGETGLAEDVFPVECPFTIEEILDDGFYPYEEGSAEQTRKENR